MTTPNRTIPTVKRKGEGLVDYYDCRECGRRWTTNSKKIGHKKQACDRYHKEKYGWV